MTLALSTLCEDPRRRTGLTTLFEQLVSASLRLDSDLRWIVFTSRDCRWSVDDARVTVVSFGASSANIAQRLLLDHFIVPGRALAMGAAALVTVGFVPLRKPLPIIAHILSLQHTEGSNGVGFHRRVYRSSMVKRAAAAADLIITNSGWAANQLLTRYPHCSDRLLTSFEGINHSQFSPSPEKDELSELHRRFALFPGYFLWVSNFYSYKQAELLIKAYAGLSPGLRHKAPLVMAGGPWGDGARNALAAAAPVRQHVRMLGWVSDDTLPMLYRNAVAFCQSSREETFGRSVVEAMACGTPCLINDIPVMREITGENALFVQIDNSKAATLALECLLKDQRLCRELSEKGHAHSLKFSFDKLAEERLEAIYRTLKVPLSGSLGPRLARSSTSNRQANGLGIP
jgi:glycosyltransferase involved in cell wall biosynthesis